MERIFVKMPALFKPLFPRSEQAEFNDIDIDIDEFDTASDINYHRAAASLRIKGPHCKNGLRFAIRGPQIDHNFAQKLNAAYKLEYNIVMNSL
jgi:hypothetical protein